MAHILEEPQDPTARKRLNNKLAQRKHRAKIKNQQALNSSAQVPKNPARLPRPRQPKKSLTTNTDDFDNMSFSASPRELQMQPSSNPVSLSIRPPALSKSPFFPSSTGSKHIPEMGALNSTQIDLGTMPRPSEHGPIQSEQRFDPVTWNDGSLDDPVLAFLYQRTKDKTEIASQWAEVEALKQQVERQKMLDATEKKRIELEKAKYNLQKNARHKALAELAFND